MLRTGTFVAVIAIALAVTPFMASAPDDFAMVPVRVDGASLSVMIDEVTVAQWQACVDDGACAAVSSAVASAGTLPVTGVNWFDVQAFIAWSNARQGRNYRLPTTAEWRVFSGKGEHTERRPLFDDPRMAWAANYGQEETPRGPLKAQGSWSTSKDGIRDLEGNVWEWTASCITDNPIGIDAARCPAMHVAGAHDAVLSVFVRNPASGGCATGKPPTHVGFRLVEDRP